jgi:hypothetical protein
MGKSQAAKGVSVMVCVGCGPGERDFVENLKLVYTIGKTNKESRIVQKSIRGKNGPKRPCYYPEDDIFGTRVRSTHWGF